MKKLIAIICLFLLSNTLQAQYSGGSGTSADPYKISTAADLINLGNRTFDYSKHFIMTADIDLAGQTFTQAVIAPDTSTNSGFQGTAFNGKFDGAGYIISNLTINASGKDFIGLFGYADSVASITNLGLENINVSGRSSVGGLVGYNRGTISNNYATGAVTGSYNYVGGLVGINNSGTINNSYATGAVTGSGTYVGGLVGLNNSGTINNSYFYLFGPDNNLGIALDDIQLIDHQSFIGFDFDDIWDIDPGYMPRLSWQAAPGFKSPIGNIVTTLAGGGYENDPFIIASYDDMLEFRNNSALRIGHYRLENNIDLGGVTYSQAFIPEIFRGVFDGNGYIISNLTIAAGGQNNIGLFAQNSGQISNLGLENADITGRNFVGGLVGWDSGTIDNSYATGAVNGEKSVGGLVGYNSGPISNSYATGAVKGRAVISMEDVGGLVGSNSSSISNSYATGAVTGSGNRVGVLVGKNTGGIISNSYFYLFGGPDNGLGIALDDSQLIDQQNFVGFDFSDIWDIEPGYMPRLSWQVAPGFSPPVDIIITTLAGNGYENDPFIIASYDDMLEFRNNSALRIGHYRLENDIDLGGVTYSQAFIPEIFRGAFDGNDHIISNLSIDAVNRNNIGLFAHNSGQISNIGLENVDITASNSVGGLVGLNYGPISNSYATGAVNGKQSVGGLVGYSSGSISNSYATGAVTGSSNSVGGLVGSGGNISNSYATGAVTGNSSVGGLVGWNFGPISNSYFYLYGGPDNGRGVALDDSQLVDQQSFVGFDFTDTWAIEPGYMPRLSWQASPGFKSPIDSIVTTLSGTGYPDNPFIIASYDNMLEFRNNLSLRIGYYRLGNDIDLGGVTYGQAFIPEIFKGVFDGNGYIISNLTIAAVNRDYIGLFSRNLGKISNLGLENIDIAATNYVGGMAGMNVGSISNSYATGAVTGSGDRVGGLVGSNPGITSNSYATGVVNGRYYVGGLVGWNSGITSNSYATGAVNGNSSVGGLVGWNSGTISNSYFYLYGGPDNGRGVALDDSQLVDQQSFVGFDFTDTWAIEPGYMPRLSWQAAPGFKSPTVSIVTTLSGNGYADDPFIIASYDDLMEFRNNLSLRIGYYSLENDIDLGGITYNEAFIPGTFKGVFDGNDHIVSNLSIDAVNRYDIGLFAHNSGQISNIGLENANISGNRDYVGGLVGWNDSGSISNSYATGAVKGINYVGGLVGWNDSGIISNSYATGTVNGSARVGGLVGHNDFSSISNSYATGAVHGSLYVGGLVGMMSNPSAITACFWDMQTSGTTIGVGTGSTTGVTGKTTAQMQQAATFSDWDSGIWGIADGFSYPYLQNLVPSFKLEITVFGPGGVSLSPEPIDGGYAPGTLVTITAQLQELASIKQWYGVTVTSELTATVIMDSHKIARVEFFGEIEIDSLATLAKIGNDPGYPLYCSYYLANDIDASATAGWNDAGTDSSILEGFRPIGNSINAFTGSFDGRGYVITGLTINRPNTELIGLFGAIGSDASVINLGLEDVNISGGYRTGGLAGGNSGIVSNCYVTGTVNGSARVGGLIGETTVSLSDCYAVANVSGGGYVGGLIGYASNSTIANCYTGIIEQVSAVNISGSERIGGLLGYGQNTIIDECYSTANINSTGSFSGGLIGELNGGAISNSYTTGNISGRSYTGGLAGGAIGNSINNCYATGDISGHSYTGGLIGSNSGNVTASYANNSVIGHISDRVGGLIGNDAQGIITDCYASGSVSGRDYVGGLVGYKSQGSITRCYSITDITARDLSGGLVGRNDNCAISICFASGTITGNNYVGGLIGANSGAVHNCYAAVDTSGRENIGGFIGGLAGNQPISNCYSYGAVSGQMNVSGLIANTQSYSGSTDFNSLFWDTETSGIAYSSRGIGKRTAQMQNIQTYIDAGWADFGAIWFVPQGQYPQLRGIGNAPLAYSGGSGTQQDPYQIGCDAALLHLANNPADYDKYFIMTADIDLSATYFTRAVIAADIDSAMGGFQGTQFTGSFDGNGHIISSLTIAAEANDFLGLFGYVGSVASIKNLGLENVNIKGRDYVGSILAYNSNAIITNCYATGTVTGRAYVGGFSAFCLIPNMSDCYAYVAVKGQDRVGGLIGHLSGGIVERTYSIGKVEGQSNAGGLIGFISNATVRSSAWDTQASGMTTSAGGGYGLTTEQLKSAATYANSGWDFDNIWGIVDDQSYPYLLFSPPPFKLNIIVRGNGSVSLDPQPIDGGYAPGTLVTLTASPGPSNIFDYWQGLTPTGELTATILMDSNKYITAEFRAIIEIDTLEKLAKIGNDPAYPLNGHYALTADIDASETINWSNYDAYGWVHGFKPIGKWNGYFHYTYDITSFRGIFDGRGYIISNLYIHRPGNNNHNAGLFGCIGLGGIVKNLGIVNSHINADVSVGAIAGFNFKGTVVNCFSKNNIITGYGNLGGLVGANHSIISNSYSISTVTGISSSIGGLAGGNYGGTVYNCYSGGTVAGQSSVGGLVGLNRTNFFTTNDAALIKNCYSTADVSGNSSSSGGIGGLVGANNNSTILNSYSAGSVTGTGTLGGMVGTDSSGTITASGWDMQTSGLETSAGGTGLTTAQMQTQSSFDNPAAGWDFENIWKMHPHKASYPRLWYQVDIAGDIAGRDGVDLEDFSALANGWLAEYDLEDLQILMQNWLVGLN